MKDFLIAVIGERGADVESLADAFKSLEARVLVCNPSDQVPTPDAEAEDLGRNEIPFERALQRTDVNAVAIELPTELAAKFAEQAMTSGKDVLILGLPSQNPQRIAELYEIAQETGRSLMVGYGLDRHPGIEKLRDIIAEGQLGRIHYIYADQFQAESPNPFERESVEIIATIVRLLREIPTEVSIVAPPPGLAHSSTTFLSFSEGRRAHIFGSIACENRLVVCGQEKSAVFKFTARKAELAIYDQRVSLGDPVSLFAKADSISVALPFGDSVASLCRCFIAAVNPPRAANEAAVVIGIARIMAACQESAALNGAPCPILGTNGNHAPPRLTLN